ncbi:MAG: hypothetical protein LBS65_10840, partial [Desulfovibrio sp.]|nr:hypothetical protein [Desulfovibrio sp.]
LSRQPISKAALTDKRFLVERVAVYEKEIIRTALEEYDGDYGEAAKTFGTHKATLYRKMKK